MFARSASVGGERRPAAATDRARPALGSARSIGRAATLAVVPALLVWMGIARDLPPISTMLQGAVALALVAWWAPRIVRGEGLPRSPLALPAMALLASTAASALVSVDRRLSLDGVLWSLTLALLFFAAGDRLRTGWDRRTLVDALLLVGAVAIGLGLLKTASWHLEWWAARVPGYPPFPAPFRLFGVNDWPTQLAALIALLVPFAIVGLARSDGLPSKAWHAAWLVGADVVLFYTRSRAGWVAVCVAAAVTVGWLLVREERPSLGGLRRWLWRTRRVWLATLAYAALFAALFWVTRVGGALPDAPNITRSGGSVESLAGRPLTWSVAWGSFVERPLLGTGPLTFGLRYASHTGTTREWVSPHAHNLFLDVLSQQGIVGLVALGWVLVAVTRALLGAWRQHGVGRPGSASSTAGLVVGCAASLLAYLAVAQVDMPTWQPANALVLLGVVALCADLDGRAEPGPRVNRVWLAVPLLLGASILLGRWGEVVGRGAMWEAFSRASDGDWRQAARALDAATLADPSLTIAHAQRGFAYGVIADPLVGAPDPIALAEGLRSYDVAASGGLWHVPDLLNYYWLLRLAGRAAPTGLLEVAAERGQDRALPLLLLADRRAAEGDLISAEALIRAAFSAEPSSPRKAACRRSAACRDLAARLAEPAGPSASATWEAERLLAAGDARAALAALAAVPPSESSWLPWVLRARAHAAAGELRQAAYALRVAESAGAAGSPQLALARAAIELAEGRRQRAIAALEEVARPSSTQAPHSFVVYRRLELPGSLLPRLALLQRSPDHLPVYRELAALYRQDGRVEAADVVDRERETLEALLAGSDPDGTWASLR